MRREQAETTGARPWYVSCHFPPSVKLTETLRECAELERRIAGFYEQFASLWSDPPEVRAFWEIMAREELGHAAALEELADEIAGLPPRGRLDRSALAQLRGYVTGRGRIVGEISLDDAFRTALDLESLELDRVYRLLIDVATRGSHPRKDAFERTLSKIGPHKHSLLEMIERHALAEDLRKEVARRRQIRARPPVNRNL